MAAPPPPVPETLEELNARIDLVELRVVRRDMEFRQHALSLKARGRAALAPSHWVRPLLGVGSGWLFWRLFRRKPHRHAGRGRAASRGRPARGAGLFGGLLAAMLGAQAHGHDHAAKPGPHAPGSGHGAGADHHEGKGKPELALLQMLTMAWSFMPARLRGSLGPETTQLVLGVVAGLVHGLQRKRKEHEAATGAQAQADARQAGASVREGMAAAPAPRAAHPAPGAAPSGVSAGMPH